MQLWWGNVTSIVTNLDFGGISKTFFAAGLGAAVFQLVTQWVRDRHTRQSHASYLAMRLASDLESFVLSCVQRASQNESADHPPEEQYPTWNISIPPLSEFPLEVEGWRYLDRHLADRCLRLRNRIELSKGLIDLTVEHSEDELGDEAIKQVAQLGTEAWSIAISLRKGYRLAAVDLSGWDYPGVLSSLLAATNKRQMEKYASSKLPVTPVLI